MPHATAIGAAIKAKNPKTGEIYAEAGEEITEKSLKSLNEHGYKEECKYARGSNFSGIRYPSSRFGAAGTDKCKYESSDKGYKEECKYAKVKNTTFRAAKVKPVKYHPVRTVTYKAPKYKAPKVHEVKYDAPKAKPHAWYDVKGAKGPKVHEEKAHPGKGPKH